MRTLCLPLCAGLLAAAVPAQVSSVDVVVANSSGLTLVNPVTQKSRAVQGTPSGRFANVALNPLDTADVWGISSGLRRCAGRAPSLDYFQMTGDKISKTTLGCRDFRIFGTLNRMDSFRNALLFSISGSSGGVYMREKTATRGTLIGRGNAMHIAVLGEKIYFSAPTGNTITEIDMSGTSPKLRTLTLSLDFDWFYRKFLSALGKECANQSSRAHGKFMSRVENRLQWFITGIFRHHGPEGILARTWPTGSTVLWVAVLLALYMIFYFV